MASNYEAICKENQESYGTKGTQKSGKLAAGLYDDRTHFIFELLQNAEDALGRRGEWHGSRKVAFTLNPTRLMLSHFGKPFDEADVRSICDIAESTKNESPIGRFGLGFKSVYTVTDLPEIHSGDEDFAIENYVFPKRMARSVRAADETQIIPRLFRQLYDLDESQQTEEHEVDLIKQPPNGYYEVSAAKDKIVRMHDAQIKDDERAKSFHLDTYCFDSGSENWLFWDLLREQRVKKIYFTGMLTHGQSDFFIQYIDPDSRTVRSYYPDFIFQREEPDGSLKYVIVEVKADNQIEDDVVQAKKDFAQQIAVASGMEYRILKSSDADKRNYRVLI